MPTYEYRCTKCGYDFETFQKFTDEPLSVCPRCGSVLRKVFNAVGIVFKGSGFYSTDNHTAGQHAIAAGTETAKTTAKDAPASADKTSPASETKTSGGPDKSSSADSVKTPAAGAPAA